MKAMILAAGFGTRLRPLTDTVPKPLLPVGGIPLIVWNLLLLRRHGITDVLINVHHLGTLIEKALGDGSQYGMQVSYSREQDILGTGGGLKQGESYFVGEPFVVVNGDTLFELDLDDLIERHRASASIATMVIRQDPEAARWGEILVDDRGFVRSIAGRPLPGGGARGGHMFAGIHVMHPRLLVDVEAGKPSSIIDAYVRALERGERVSSHRLSGYWSDVGTPERYAQAQRDAESGAIRLEDRKR